MEHRIILLNKDDETISQVKFSPWDFNSTYFYDLFDARAYYEGYNGFGRTVEYKQEQMELAYTRFMKIREYSFIYNHEGLEQEKRESVDRFIKNGIKTAKKEGVVKICYKSKIGRASCRERG